MDVRAEMLVFPGFRGPDRSFCLRTSAGISAWTSAGYPAPKLTLWAAFSFLTHSPYPSDFLFPCNPTPPPFRQTPPGCPTREGSISVHFGSVRVRLAPFRGCPGSVSGCLVGSGWGLGEGRQQGKRIPPPYPLYLGSRQGTKEIT